MDMKLTILVVAIGFLEKGEIIKEHSHLINLSYAYLNYF